MTEHYFTEKPTSQLKIFKLRTILRNTYIDFFTATGLFSFTDIDKGTQLLINKSIIKDKWKVLDLGCGYGIVGVSLKKFFPTLAVTFSDINQRALELTRKNLSFHHLEGTAIHSNGFEHIDGKFNTILLNPPQTAGKELCFKLITESKEHLLSKGLLQVVARHQKGGRELGKKMLETFGNVKETAKGAGYRIYVSQK